MGSKVVLFSTATHDLAKLPQAVQKRVAIALRDLAAFPERHTGIRKLKPPFEGYRKRVGNHRIFFDYVDGTVFVHHIKDRKDAYR